MERYFGKYRGLVMDNVDPMLQGRILVKVPSLFGDFDAGWAMPCVPYAGPGIGFFAMPPVGANIWVEFEEGNPERPIWAGCFWDENDLPVTSASPETMIWKTETSALTMIDTVGMEGFTLELANGMKIAMDATKLEITNGQGAAIIMDGAKITLVSESVEGI